MLKNKMIHILINSLFMKILKLMSLNLNDVNDSVFEDDLKQRGIYVIINTCNNKVYAGKTEKSFKYRYNCHLWALKKKCHDNKHLQNSFNKYGSDAFIFCIYKMHHLI